MLKIYLHTYRCKGNPFDSINMKVFAMEACLIEDNFALSATQMILNQSLPYALGNIVH